MVRSKFPGKPSKIVNRKVVKSCKYSVLHDNESSKAAQNISYGLAVFNETFGDHEQVLTAFHGFSPHEVDNAREIANDQQEKVLEEYLTSGSNFPSDNAISVKLDPPTPQDLSYVAANLSLIGPVGWHTTRAQCQSLQSESKGNDLVKSISPAKFFSPVKPSFKKHVASRLLHKAKKVNLDVCSSRISPSSLINGPSNVTNLNKKFVLPCRSVRSSRVIKPNKRFLEPEGGLEDPPSPPSLSGQSIHGTRVIELKKPKLILDRQLDFSAQLSDSSINKPYERKITKEPSKSTNSTGHVKFAELHVFGAPTTRPKRQTSQSSEDSPKKDRSATSSTSSEVSKPRPDAVSPSRSKLILRESKLNISSSSGNVTEGQFSTKPKKGLGSKVAKSPGVSVECGVCGAVRFYRLTKQSLKFGLICCEPCRKFIAKMMLRSKSSDSSVPCDNGQGNCAVSSPLNSESFATKVNRCGACWLLLCVQRLVKMPDQIRDSLIRMLPANMQGMTVVLPVAVVNYIPSQKNRKGRKGTLLLQDETDDALTSPQRSPKLNNRQATPTTGRKLSVSSSNKIIAQTPIARIKRKAALVSLANNLRRVRDKTFSPITPPGAVKKSICTEKTLKMKKLYPSKKSELNSVEKPLRKGSNKNLVKMKDGQVRQKLSLKGPRVKHVCRSASIVLGQPLATFPNASPTNSPIKSSELYVDSNLKSDATVSVLTFTGVHDKASRLNQDNHQEIKIKKEGKPGALVGIESSKDIGMKSSASQLTMVTTTVADAKFLTRNPLEHRTSQNYNAGRKVTRLPNIQNLNKMIQRGQRRTLQDLGIYNNQAENLPELISLDFWESYDPDEVCFAGFGLIGFDPFHMKPVCFLCGSAGKRKLIHCASCCEPYHQFCIEMGALGGSGPLPLVEQSSKEVWRVDWVCPRCTVCHGCGYNSGRQLTACQRCHHSFHLECLGTTGLRKSAGDRLWICASCLRCKSCNSTDVSKFVGNLPFCKVCFKLRQKGNFCPLCQGCYTDDDFQSKMMECADCKSWVHAKCEGLSDEKYQVLSYLPESVEFICRLCCTAPPAPWWVAVEAELQAGYSNIIKAITKNRKAYAMLKWSPQKTCSCQNHLSLPSESSALAPGKRRLSFNLKSSKEANSIAHICAEASQSTKGTGREAQTSSVFEFDEDIDAGENAPITKYSHTKEKCKIDGCHEDFTKLHLDCGNDEKPVKSAQCSPNAGCQSDSGVGSTDDELKTCSAAEEEEAAVEMVAECTCITQSSRVSFPTLLTVKKKVQSSEYSSILDFHRDMDQLIREADSHEVKELYHQTLLEVFPWFDTKYDRVSRNSFPLSPLKAHHGSRLQYLSSSATPEKTHPDHASSVEILERLLPKETSKLDDEYFYYGMNPVDTRICGFCKLTGDTDACAEGRLLYCGLNEWVHVNCALWSAEVFEEIDGALQNVSNALSRGRMIRCSLCGHKGASVGCCAKKCEETLHFPCARTAGFVFMEDKNVFCSLHSGDAPGKPLSKLLDFDVCRPVFVELDRRKKKSVESKHVRLMIGSLLVQSLGTIVPELSDIGTSIIPTQFSCTRLFWSSKEPWRIVRYTIRTSVRLPTPEPIVDLGHHVTVDHSKDALSPNPISESPENMGIKVEDFSIDPNSLKDADIISNKPLTDNAKIAEAVVNHLLDSICCRETDEEVTDPQNSADLLPPELKDAIFEDLPHDLLDGISMQDIFQDKFLNFEELSKEDSQEDNSSNGPPKSDTDKQKTRNFKAPRELKRSKSDVLPGNSSYVDSRLHQRSCSLAWSYKLGTNITCCKTQKVTTSEAVMDRTKLIQELHLSVKPAPTDVRHCHPGPGDKGKENQSLSWSRIMQVDGISDAGLMSGSDEGSDLEPTDMVPNFSGKQNLKYLEKFSSNLIKDSELLRNRIECLKTVTSAAFTRKGSEFVNQDFHVKRKKSIRKPIAERKRVSSTRRVFQIPQLDGTNDISSDSEQEGSSSKPLQDHCEEKPVRCSRCGCTYRTEESHARHLPSCSGDFSLTTSESEGEMTEDEVESAAKSVSSPSPDSAISVSSGSLSGAASTSPITLPPASPIVPATVPLVVSTPTSAVFKTERNSSTPQVGKDTIMKSVQSNLQSFNRPVQEAVSATINKVQRMSANKSKVTKTSSQQQSVKLILKGNQSVLHHQVYKQSNHQQMGQPTLQHSLPTSIAPQPSQIITMMDYQQSQQTGPTVLVQSVPSQAMVPSYLEAFQQHTGQNLQYLTTVDTNQGYGKTQYLTAVPSSVVPGAYQIQAMPDGQLCLEPSSVGIPTISGLQLAQAQLPPTQIAQAQAQVLGTILQSPLPCGVMATTEPIYETIQMFPDQSGGVLLASQPMLTCMETVVSNTYMSMSSSQFVSSSVPGILQGSSTFSTTTTQVFQASKVDPPVLDVPTQYVVVNTHPQLSDAAVGKLEVMSISQPHIQEQTSIQTQARIHMPSINLPVPVTMTAPLPPQTLPPVIPTSVVTPMPRVQPQRTYSKPTKGTKETVVPIVKKTVSQVTCSALKETMKKMSNQTVSKSTKELTLSAMTSSFKVEMSKEPKLMESTSKKPAPPQAPAVMNSLPSSVTPVQSTSEALTAITAPARSITLPDPVKLNPPVINGPKVLSTPVLMTAVKCPPVTFSYRAHAVEKVKPKVVTDLPIKIQESKAQPGHQGSKHFNSLPVNSEAIPSPASVHLETKKHLPFADYITKPLLDSLTSLKKPTAAVLPQSQVVGKSDLKKMETIKIVASNAPPISRKMPVKISSASNVKLASAPIVSLAVSSTSASNSSIISQPPNQASSNPSQGQVGKNVALSLMTASITDSTTSTATTVTSSNSTVPLTTTKLQSSNVTSLKPLQEINQMKQNLEIKPIVLKMQEKEACGVPPSVLKSSSQNIDASKKSDAFSAQGELPLGPANAANSSTSLKLLFQKQAHNGCYKVSSSPGKKDCDLMAIKLADINIISNGLKDKKGIKDENMKPVDKVSKKVGPLAPEILYEIHCPDGFSYSSTSISDAWQKVFGAVQEARSNHKMPPLIHNPFNSLESGHNVMGLGNNSLKYLLEQLPGVGNCSKYRPIYHKSRLPGPGYQFKREDHDLKESYSGCARTDPYLSAKKYDMFSWLDSRHRRPPKLLDNNDIDALTGSRRTASTSLPMAMRFRHLRETSKTSVGVFRSDIHGRGLFCLRDIEAGEMVIEYAGEVIRNTLTDNREKYYQSKGIGCYMFKVDDNFTVDATQKGNAARFINHSCEPNCYSRVVDILGKKHIIIFAFRRIPQGEELTYDYKFPIEDEKIHCHCLARRCRKYLN